MQIYRRLKHVGLFAVGCTLGSLAVFTLQGGGTVNIADGIGIKTGGQYEDGHEAIACTPDSKEKDSVFFVSCGGIY